MRYQVEIYVRRGWDGRNGCTGPLEWIVWDERSSLQDAKDSIRRAKDSPYGYNIRATKIVQIGADNYEPCIQE